MLARILFPIFLVACSGSDIAGSPLQGGENTNQENEEVEVDAGKTHGSGGGKGDGGGMGGNRDAAADVTPAPTDGGKAAFGAACNDNAQCESNLCFNFNQKGKRCTLSCAGDNDCPASPGLGCSGNQKVCRVP